MAKRDLPELSDLSDDPQTRYGELEKLTRRLAQRAERRIEHLNNAMAKLRSAEEVILKREGIDYEYFGFDDEPKPKQEPGHVVMTCCGIVYLYGVDDARLHHIDTCMEELDKERGITVGNVDELTEIISRYEEFMSDFAIRYAKVIVVGEENVDCTLAAVYCLGKKGKAMLVAIDVRHGSSSVVDEEDATIDDYLSEPKQKCIIAEHTAYEPKRNVYILTHPSDMFDHEVLADAAGQILQQRYFNARPDAKKGLDAQEHIAKAIGVGKVLSVVNEVTKDPFGVSKCEGKNKSN